MAGSGPAINATVQNAHRKAAFGEQMRCLER